jgi:RNAse (barnase) inhibitor barstar
LTPGVYRVASADDTVRTLARSGWDVRLAAPATSTAGLYAALAGALDLPSWFGANLDALWDCLTDLSAPTALVLCGWGAFERAEPEQARRVVEVFAERALAEPPFTVALARD